jgi:hypothetical protein
MAKMKPTGLEPTYLREMFEVVDGVLYWRADRPLSHFPVGGEGARANWRARFAGKPAGSREGDRLRVRINGVIYNVQDIAAEIGTTSDGLPSGYGTTDGGPLAQALFKASMETRRSLEDLSVLNKDSDPYRIDTDGKREAGRWFADQVARFVAPDRRIHVRGVFYAVVSAGDVMRPDGSLFINDTKNEAWLGDAASYARWLGYVDFERIVDAKNAEPVVRPAPEIEDPAPRVMSYGLEIDELDADTLTIEAGLTGFAPRQPYRLTIFGEKTSLEDVLGPLAEEFGADLYLTGGQISDTLMHRMAKDADDDGRPLVVFTFSDCDPAGYWDMPTAIGRKLQALRDLKFPELEFTVVHAALSPDQARGLGLPSSPLKEGEKRGVLWQETYGLEQTEIDALATLQPDVLERLAREAVGPYFDPGLALRVSEARDTWLASAQNEIEAQIDDDALDALKTRAQAAIEELHSVNAELDAMRDQVEIGEPVPDLPEADMDALHDAQDERRDAVLIDSDMDYVEGTDRLRAHNELAARQEASKARKIGKAGR